MKSEKGWREGGTGGTTTYSEGEGEGEEEEEGEEKLVRSRESPGRKREKVIWRRGPNRKEI